MNFDPVEPCQQRIGGRAPKSSTMSGSSLNSSARSVEAGAELLSKKVVVSARITDGPTGAALLSCKAASTTLRRKSPSAALAFSSANGSLSSVIGPSSDRVRASQLHFNRVAARLECLAHRVTHGGHEGLRLRVDMDEVDAHWCRPGPLRRASGHPW